MPILRPFVAQSRFPVSLVPRFRDRAGGAFGSSEAARSSLRPSHKAAGATVSRKNVARLAVPDVIPIVGVRPGPSRSPVSIPSLKPDRTEAGARLLSELVGKQDVLLGMPADRKRSVLDALAVRLAERAGMSHGAVLAAFLRRERLGPTVIGNGVAVPHARLDGISAPAAALATLQRPVPFDTQDDVPVDLLFALLWPASDMKGFVPTLRGVWRQLRNTALADLLRQSRTPAEAYAWIESFEEEGRKRPAQPP